MVQIASNVYFVHLFKWEVGIHGISCGYPVGQSLASLNNFSIRVRVDIHRISRTRMSLGWTIGYPSDAQLDCWWLILDIRPDVRWMSTGQSCATWVIHEFCPLIIKPFFLGWDCIEWTCDQRAAFTRYIQSAHWLRMAFYLIYRGQRWMFSFEPDETKECLLLN